MIVDFTPTHHFRWGIHLLKQLYHFLLRWWQEV